MFLASQTLMMSTPAFGTKELRLLEFVDVGTPALAEPEGGVELDGDVPCDEPTEGNEGCADAWSLFSTPTVQCN